MGNKDTEPSPVHSPGYNMAWQGRRLTSASKSGTNVTYAYDENGIRTRKTVNGTATNYYYHGSTLISLERGSDTLLFSYDSNGQVAAVKYGGNYYYYLYNGQGDVVAIMDSNYATVVQYSYDIWGKLLSTTGSKATTLGVLNPFRYRGYVYDEETKLYYLNSRYYDPETCRFISADDADVLHVEPSSLLHYNLYAYCWSIPVNMTDDNGYLPWFVAAAAVGALFDTATYLIGSAISGQKITWAGVGKAALTGAVTGVAFGALGKGVKVLTAATKATKIGIKIGTTFGKMGKLVKYRRIAVDWGNITRHGLQRMSERGMSKSLINSVIKNGKVLQQSTNKFAYISKKGVVIIESNGKIVTAYSSEFFDETMKGYVKKLFN